MAIDWNEVEFINEKAYLSNMYSCTIKFDASKEFKAMFPNVDFDGEIYESSEHIYVAMKSQNKKWHQMVRDTDNPKDTKKLNRKHIKKDILFDTDKEFLLRSDWDEIKVEVMSAVVLLKFIQNKDLAKKLILLEGQIEERNYWNDIFWGTCKGIGENYLGRILMRVRKYLIENNLY